MKAPLKVEFHRTLGELTQILGVSTNLHKSEIIHSLCLDSRSLEKGDVFFALKNERDGHDFVEDALKKGALVAIVEKEINQKKVIKVQSVQEALYKLAKDHREKWGKKVVAISGSNGKTTTKEMVGVLLSQQVNVHRSQGSWNNHLGVPLTILGLKSIHDVLVQEMGMNHAHEIEAYCRCALPDVGVLTHIGPAHIEMFGSVENIARAKAELFEGVKPEGTLVVNVDNPWIKNIASQCNQRKITVSLLEKADVRGYFNETEKPYDDLVIECAGEKIHLNFPKLGLHNARNFLCAVGVLKALNLPLSLLQEGLDQLKMPEMRMEKSMLKNQLEVVCDCYNANPDSMDVALSSFKKDKREKVFIVGDMKELGTESRLMHEQVGEKAIENGFLKIWALGEFAPDLIEGAHRKNKTADLKNFSNMDDLCAYALKNLSPGALVLLKGSRSMKMERVLSFLQQHIGEA